MVPRRHIRDLEIQLEQLEAAAAEQDLSAASPHQLFINAEKATGLHTLHQEASPASSPNFQSQAGVAGCGSDPRFPGDSSGIYLARSVLETARLRNGNFDIETAQFISTHDSQAPEAQTNRPTARALAPAVWLPYSTAQGLVQVFFSTCQVQYPILSQDSF
jgi:hypothetical protein